MSISSISIIQHRLKNVERSLLENTRLLQFKLLVVIIMGVKAHPQFKQALTSFIESQNLLTERYELYKYQQSRVKALIGGYNAINLLT